MSHEVLFFDLDDTLYPSSIGLWQLIRARMGDYMIERLGLPDEEVPALRKHYFQTYGTTLRGLQMHYQIDTDEYLAYVHDIPLDQYLQPQPELRAMLLSLPYRRWIFTNADNQHAQRVLVALGLSECFEGIIDVRAMGFACKPEALAFERALKLAGSPAPQKSILLDDSASNLMGARRFGFTTVLVGHNDPAEGSG